MAYPRIPHLRLGTSSWCCEDWVATFYPRCTPPADFLGAYAQHFHTVEGGSAYYRIPSEPMVRNWRDRTPGFIFWPSSRSIELFGGVWDIVMEL